MGGSVLRTACAILSPMARTPQRVTHFLFGKSTSVIFLSLPRAFLFSRAPGPRLSSSTSGARVIASTVVEARGIAEVTASSDLPASGGDPGSPFGAELFGTRSAPVSYQH